LVARTFGALPTREASLQDFASARSLSFPPPDAHPLVLHHAGAVNRAMALVYWPGVDDSDIKRARTLELLRSVFELKLIERVREAEGATYSPSAQAFFAHANPGYGYLGVSLDLVPGDVDRFFGVVDQIAASLAAGAITPDELERARAPILQEFQHGLEDNQYWLRVIATAQSDPRALDRHRSTERDYLAATIADLRAAAARYLRQDHAFRIAILPRSGTLSE
jgi:zinc protease